MRNQNSKSMALLFSSGAIGSYPQLPKSISASYLQLLFLFLRVGNFKEKGNQSSCIWDGGANNLESLGWGKLKYCLFPLYLPDLTFFEIKGFISHRNICLQKTNRIYCNWVSVTSLLKYSYQYESEQCWIRRCPGQHNHTPLTGRGLASTPLFICVAPPPKHSVGCFLSLLSVLLFSFIAQGELMSAKSTLPPVHSQDFIIHCLLLQGCDQCSPPPNFNTWK